MLFLTPGCNNNYLESFATNTDNDSLYWAAQSALWASGYTTAINACTSMSADYIVQDNVAQVCASAYAGRCGYSLNWMLTNLPTIAASPPLMLGELGILQTQQTTAQVSDCEAAETILEGIGTAAQRSNDANMEMVMITLYKMGVIASNLASNNLGGVTVGFNACGIAAADQQALGIALWDLNQSIAQLSSVQFVSAVATIVNAQCTALAAIGEDTCNVNNTNGFNPLAMPASALKGAESTLREGAAFGLNLCGGNQSVATCGC